MPDHAETVATRAAAEGTKRERPQDGIPCGPGVGQTRILPAAVRATGMIGAGNLCYLCRGLFALFFVFGFPIRIFGHFHRSRLTDGYTTLVSQVATPGLPRISPQRPNTRADNDASSSAPGGRSKVSPCQWKTVSVDNPRKSRSSPAPAVKRTSYQPISLTGFRRTAAPSARAINCEPRQIPRMG